MKFNTSVLERKQFQFESITFDAYDRVELSGVRHYQTPGGNYPSVTTVLGAMTDKSGVDQWRNRVGNEEADRIGKLAATRGTNVHQMLEDYVRGLEVDTSMPFNTHLFKQVKRVLDASVDNVIGCEVVLKSDYLKVAGTCDLIANYDGTLSIIDYKTSAKNKMKNWIEGYFLQTSLYSYMLWEMTGMLAKNVVVIIAVDEETQPQVFVESPKDYVEKAISMVKSYHKGKTNG